MGYAFYELVTAAIMHDNPGCTKEELAKILLETNMSTGEIPLYKLIDESWRRELKYVETGHKEKSKELFIIKSQPRERTKIEKRNFIVTQNLSRWDNSNNPRFKEGEIANYYHSGVYGLGQLLNLPQNNLIHYLEFRYGKDFLRTRNVSVKFDDFVGGKESFSSIEELARNERFFPESMFDFSKEEGSFLALERSAHIYRWIKKRDKFYFDFDKMKDSVDVFGFNQSMDRYLEPCSYTDFMVTLEAVRRKAWKILSYRGLTHKENFFKKYPDYLQLYGKQVWDSFTSLDAKRRKLTHNQFMRERLLSVAKM